MGMLKRLSWEVVLETSPFEDMMNEWRNPQNLFDLKEARWSQEKGRTGGRTSQKPVTRVGKFAASEEVILDLVESMQGSCLNIVNLGTSLLWVINLTATASTF